MALIFHDPLDGVEGLTDGLVEEERFADIFDLGNGAFEVKGFGEDDFEDLSEEARVSIAPFI
jgi:hypothetical protein